MTLAQLLAMMATLQCHTTSIDVPERRETLAYTVCVKVEVTPIVKEEPAPVVKKTITKKAGVGCKKRWYWKNHRKRWRCVR